MKPFYKDLFTSIVFGLLVPGLLLGIGSFFHRDMSPEQESTVAQIHREQREISVLTENGIRQMGMEDYLTGVILAEMPASFAEEAQKAQAVVARTYTFRASNGKSKHQDAVVCTDSACCQGYLSDEDYLTKGGTQEGIGKMRKAVQQTADLVLVYEDQLIEATYFSCSGGTTEDAVAVWGTDIAYLQSVTSPGEENATHYSDTVVYSPEEFEKALDIKLSNDPGKWIEDVTYTQGNGVDTMVICGNTFKGTDLRKRLDLRSTSFTMNAQEDKIIIVTRGYGHRVGMSQYGANAMAEEGKTFQEILAHYYQGTSLMQMED